MITEQIVLTVSQLTQAIKLHLEKQFPRIMVQGEISNFKRQASGHLYFTLKDAHSQISCAMFHSDARLIQHLPKDGDQVQIKGELNVYPPRGNYQIIVRSMQRAGLGELLQLLEERKEKFLKLGYFDSSRKKRLPPFPKTIGVITSPTGAVISDILQILDRRAKAYHVILNPVRVQGEGASKEISQAIDHFNQFQLADVLIVGRGGGSIEDLWAFNEEEVITSIAKSEIPIVTAIGHETDVTLADLAADLRAPTPSAAAELVLSEKESHEKFLHNMAMQLSQCMQHTLRMLRQKVESYIKHPYMASPHNLLRIFEQKVDEIELLIDQANAQKLRQKKEKLHTLLFKLQAQNPESKIQKKRYDLNQMQAHFDHQIKNLIQNKKGRFETLMTHLLAIDPKKVLEKGYTILFDEKSNSAIVSTKNIALKQKIKLILKDGFCEAVVEGVNPS